MGRVESFPIEAMGHEGVHEVFAEFMLIARPIASTEFDDSLFQANVKYLIFAMVLVLKFRSDLTFDELICSNNGL